MSQAMSQEMSHFPSVSSQLLWPSQHCLLMDPQGIFHCHLIPTELWDTQLKQAWGHSLTCSHELQI